MIVKAIIFDFDGVIIESMDIKARAFAHLFKDFPQHLGAIVNCHMKHGGLSRFEKFEIIYRDILHQPLSNELKAKLGKQFSDYVYQEVISCPFVSGAYEFLNRYHQSLLLFVVSGTPDKEIKAIIKERGLQKFFLEVFGAPKKKEELNLKILKKYKLNPKEVFFVGDSIDDYEGVQRLGIRFIGRITRENPFLGLKVESFINNMFDMEKIIDAQQL